MLRALRAAPDSGFAQSADPTLAPAQQAGPLDPFVSQSFGVAQIVSWAALIYADHGVLGAGWRRTWACPDTRVFAAFSGSLVVSRTALGPRVAR